jgi:hypothetical protein
MRDKKVDCFEPLRAGVLLNSRQSTSLIKNSGGSSRIIRHAKKKNRINKTQRSLFWRLSRLVRFANSPEKPIGLE